jgi:hypothetical protein
MGLACGRMIALSLDYDGTLLWIVENIDLAFMSEEVRKFQCLHYWLHSN